MRSTCEGKTALVIGGTRGIGLACTFDLADAGAMVIPIGRTMEASQKAVGEVVAAGGKAAAAAFDVADVVASRSVIDQLAEEHGRIDVLVANAGISPYWKRAEDLTVEMWDHIMNVNLRGIFFAVQAAARHMLASRSGSIIAISSATSTVGTPRGLPYAASKGGLDSMVRTLAVEWADCGIRVNGVAPGFVATDLTEGVRGNDHIFDSVVSKIPMGRFGRPEEISGFVRFLASEASSFVTGQVFLADGGQQAA